jgi:hypothetical protein
MASACRLWRRGEREKKQQKKRNQGGEVSGFFVAFNIYDKPFPALVPFFYIKE